MPAISASKYMVQAGWDDVPHLDGQTKRELLDSTPPYLQEARSTGKPGLGSGAIYPVPLDEVLEDPFEIPAHWPRAYALDVGWKRTAAIWGALDRTSDTWHLFTEHYRGKAEPSIHATAIKARGEWIPGIIDPAARGRSQEDGSQLIQKYTDLGLLLNPAKNAVEAGLYECWNRLSTGRLKVFRTLQNWRAEYTLYRRDEDGNIVKDFDHLMDAMRYLIMTGKGLAIPVPVDRPRNVVPAGAGDEKLGF